MLAASWCPPHAGWACSSRLDARYTFFFTRVRTQNVVMLFRHDFRHFFFA